MDNLFLLMFLLSIIALFIGTSENELLIRNLFNQNILEAKNDR